MSEMDAIAEARKVLAAPGLCPPWTVTIARALLAKQEEVERLSRELAKATVFLDWHDRGGGLGGRVHDEIAGLIGNRHSAERATKIEAAKEAIASARKAREGEGG